MESFEQMVERITKTWFESPCAPPDDVDCDPAMHVWETAHPDDKAYHLRATAFILRAAGL